MHEAREFWGLINLFAAFCLVVACVGLAINQLWMFAFICAAALVIASINAFVCLND